MKKYPANNQKRPLKTLAKPQQRKIKGGDGADENDGPHARNGVQ